VPTARGAGLLLHAQHIVEETTQEPRINAQTAKNASVFQGFTAFCKEVDQEPLNTTPRIAVAFLAIESRGKTVKSKTHNSKCVNYRSVIPVQDHPSCDCECSLRAGSLLGTRFSVQAALRDRGLSEPYNHKTGTGNPFLSPEVDKFCRDLASTQTDATVSRPAANWLTEEQTRRVMNIALDAHDKYLQAGNRLFAFRELRDALAVALGWCLLDRGADVVRLRFSQIAIDTNRKNIIIGKSLSKTARKAENIQPAVLIKASGDRFCVVRLLNAYVISAALLDVNVKSGTLLRTVRIQKRLQQLPGITNGMLTTADLRKRLGTLCSVARVPISGLHALRRGKARSLLLSGTPLSELAEAGDWKPSSQMPAHYTGTRKRKRERSGRD
jgi:integrase